MCTHLHNIETHDCMYTTAENQTLIKAISIGSKAKYYATLNVNIALAFSQQPNRDQLGIFSAAKKRQSVTKIKIMDYLRHMSCANQVHVAEASLGSSIARESHHASGELFGKHRPLLRDIGLITRRSVVIPCIVVSLRRLNVDDALAQALINARVLYVDEVLAYAGGRVGIHSWRDREGFPAVGGCCKEGNFGVSCG